MTGSHSNSEPAPAGADELLLVLEHIGVRVVLCDDGRLDFVGQTKALSPDVRQDAKRLKLHLLERLDTVGEWWRKYANELATRATGRLDRVGYAGDEVLRQRQFAAAEQIDAAWDEKGSEAFETAVETLVSLIPEVLW